jgi:hypothetical protein
MTSSVIAQISDSANADISIVFEAAKDTLRSKQHSTSSGSRDRMSSSSIAEISGAVVASPSMHPVLSFGFPYPRILLDAQSMSGLLASNQGIPSMISCFPKDATKSANCCDLPSTSTSCRVVLRVTAPDLMGLPSTTANDLGVVKASVVIPCLATASRLMKFPVAPESIIASSSTVFPSFVNCTGTHRCFPPSYATAETSSGSGSQAEMTCISSLE